MENQNPHQPNPEEGWVTGILGVPQQPDQELGLDESAVYSAGLTHPNDMELEKIIQETKAQEAATMTQTGFAPAESLAPEAPQVSGDTFRFEPPAEAQELPADPPRDGNDRPNQRLRKAAAASSYLRDGPMAEAPAESKRRPKMKKGSGLFGIPHILSTVIWVFVVASVGMALGRLLWVCAADVLAFGKSEKEAVITIRKNDTLEDIAQELEEKGLINYPELFVMYMKFSGSSEIQTGVLHLTPMIYDYHALKTAMAPKQSARETVEVVIPEGYTCQQIFALLEKSGVCSVEDLEEYAANGKLNDYWFLEGVERGDKYCLEGYLFPDTYQFYKSHDPELVLEKMLDAFDDRYTDLMKEKIDTLNDRMADRLRNEGYDEGYINSHRITIREVVIIASMIERETADGAESYDISGVIFNRLTSPGRYPYLNIDATVIYGLGGKIDPETGESIPLTKEDLQKDTPYNTYTRKGLIPGPISNPGRNSLNAALDPNESSYYYYVFDPQAGRHLFATNADEHNSNVAKVSKQNG